ncbi:DUF6207 family protein [Streptomyces pharetrae]|uniref:DUF6207 family protein n=1 Tax=Streptomyces pharetrae TaxID=291370 RepID=UPI00335C8004
MLAARCAIALADRTTREPGEPGVRLRCSLNLRQEPDPSSSGDRGLDDGRGKDQHLSQEKEDCRPVRP